MLRACIPGGEIGNIVEQEGDILASNTPRAPEMPNPASAAKVEELPLQAESEFRTDFSKQSVSFDEILSGGPPKDGIPAIDKPTFESLNVADEWIGLSEPVMRWLSMIKQELIRFRF